MKRKLVSMALVACIAAMTLTGCGSSSNQGESANNGGDADEVTLKFTYKQSASDDC